ncbi:MAG: hypothetical protein CUN56_14860, partial [Phototrophicales bacterium]
FTITLDDIKQNLSTILSDLDEPVANPTAVSQWFLSKWVREAGVVVALGGDGGDELFGGYTRHRAMMAADYYQRLPKFMQKFGGLFHRRARKLMKPVGIDLHVELMAEKSETIADILYSPFDPQVVAERFFSSYYEQAPVGMHSLEQFMRVDRRTWLVEESLARSDRSSMTHGLELRVPLLDIDLVRLSDTISPYRKTTPWTGKKILRELYRSHLPEYLYNQPKRGWISPGAKWLRVPEIQSMVCDVCTPGHFSELDTVINWDAIHDMLDRHVSKGGYYLQPLWNLLALQFFLANVSKTKL